MTLVKTTANLIAVLAMSCFLVPATWGQTAAQPPAPAQAPTASHNKKPVAAAQGAKPKQTAKADAKAEEKADAKPEVAGEGDAFLSPVHDKTARGDPAPP